MSVRVDPVDGVQAPSRAGSRLLAGGVGVERNHQTMDIRKESAGELKSEVKGGWDTSSCCRVSRDVEQTQSGLVWTAKMGSINGTLPRKGRVFVDNRSKVVTSRSSKYARCPYIRVSQTELACLNS